MANATITVIEADGLTQTDVVVLDVGRQAAAASKSQALATEDKAVLDAIAASLAVLDDFDETDRLKANIIVGQAGIAAGTGVDGVTVPRVTLATNVALPAGTNAIGKLSANSGVDIGDVDVTSLPAIPAGTNMIGNVTPEGTEYETVAASQTAQTLGATGGTGDYIAGVLVVPATTAPGNVLLLDNATSITIFTGGTGSVSNLVPFYIPLGIKSVSGAWKLTTGANVSAIGMGNFA